MIARVVGIGASLLTLVGGVITLIGWFGGWPRLTDSDGDGISMLPNTAVCAVAAGIALLALWTAATPRPKWSSVCTAGLGSLAALLGGLTLAQHLFGVDFGIDTLIIEPAWGARAAAAPGRMGPPASTTFLVLGAGIALAGAAAGTRRRRIASVLAVIAALPPVIALTAYLYGADPLFSAPRFTGIARQSAIILCAASLSLILAIHEFGLGAALRKKDPGGTVFRWMLPVVVVVLLVTGWAEEYGKRIELFDSAFGGALLTIVRLVLFTGALWWIAATLGRQAHRERSLEHALSESSARFRDMVNSIPQLAWMAAPDGSITWYNRRWYEYTGATPREMEGWGWQAVHDPDVLPDVMRRWKQAIDQGDPLDMVFPLRGADGRFRHFLTSIVPVKDAAGSVVQWFGTNTDITEQRAAVEALQEANRLKDEFLATLSHELRTPMSAILGWAQLLRGSMADGPVPEADLAQGLEVIERNARLQAQIIGDLLDVSRILSGKVRLDVQSVSLSAIVEAAVDAVRPAANSKGLRMQVVCDPNIRDLRGDPNRLQQVFYNLLNNAVKFTPRGGRIQVTSARVNSHVEVSVSDTGIGIKPEFLPHLFERFRQQDASTTRSFGGLGLGLNICKQLIELHGGSIHAASEGPGKGASFTVHLPVSIAILPMSVPESDAIGRRHPASGGAASGDEPEGFGPDHLRGVSALVVDDEPDAREMLQRLLERHGARAAIAGSAAEAFDALGARSFDVLICDIGMPVIDGYELIRTLRRRAAAEGGQLPAIALTAFARSEDRIKSLRAGFQMHLSKPVEAAELIATITNLTKRGDAATPK